MSITYKKKPKGIIFDCDGVIIDSYESNTQFYNSLRASVDLPPMTEEQRLQVHQMTGIDAINLVIPKALMQEASKSYQAVDYVRDIVPLLTVHEGLKELLVYCKKNDIKTGIHTNRVVAMDEILELYGFTEYFHPVMTPAKLAAKPNPIGSITICKEWGIAPKDALFIGDSMNDKLTAEAANIPFIAFKSYLEATSKAENFAEIESWLKSLK